MKNGNEIRSRITCATAVAALAISLINMGITHAGAVTTTPETDKAYGIINEDGTAKVGISSIADIRDGMTTTGADFVVDTDVDGHPETVLSPTELRNLLDVSYAADARLERSLNDLKTTTESTYLKKTDAASTYAAKSSLSNYATTAALSNYYTRSEVNSLIASSGGSSGSSNTLTTSYGKVNLDTKATYTLNQLYANFKYNGTVGEKTSVSAPYKGFMVFTGSSPSSSACIGYFHGVSAEGGIYSGVYLLYSTTKNSSKASVKRVASCSINQQTGLTISNGDTLMFTLCEPL